MEEREAPDARARGRLLPALLAVLVVVLAAGALVQQRDRDPDPAAGSVRPADIGLPGQDPDGTAGSAVLAARSVLSSFYRLDPAHARRDVERTARLMTGDLAARYAASADRLVRRVQRDRIVRVPRLVADGTATEYLTDEQALVLVTVTVRTTQRGLAARSETLRTRVGLQRVDGAWSASSLQTVGDLT